MRYHEEQRFSGGWRWFWAAVILGPGAIAAVVLLVIGAAAGIDFTVPFLIVVAVEAAMLALLILILILRAPVIVDVTDDGVRIRVPPFVKEHIPAAELVSVEAVEAGLFRRYGAGVGKRISDRRARYTVGNDAGVVIERANGWRVVIGSPRPAELAAAIRSLMRPAKDSPYRT